MHTHKPVANKAPAALPPLPATAERGNSPTRGKSSSPSPAQDPPLTGARAPQQLGRNGPASSCLAGKRDRKEGGPGEQPKARQTTLGLQGCDLQPPLSWGGGESQAWTSGLYFLHVSLQYLSLLLFSRYPFALRSCDIPRCQPSTTAHAAVTAGGAAALSVLPSAVRSSQAPVLPAELRHLNQDSVGRRQKKLLNQQQGAGKKNPSCGPG